MASNNNLNVGNNYSSKVKVEFNPNKLYTKWFVGKHPPCKCEPIKDLLLYSGDKIAKESEAVRFVCMSDIHSPSRIRKERLSWEFPPGDVLIVAGDLTLHGTRRETEMVAEWLKSTPYKHKVVIAGNHDFCLDPGDSEYSPEAEAKLKAACTYLRDSDAVLFDSIRIYGSPVTPEFHGMAFNTPRGEPIAGVWERIPTPLDVLVTHGPPLGHGDLVHNGLRAGCADLLRHVEHRVRPAYHVFGHVHEARGASTNGSTVFVNAATCNLRYFLEHEPISFDYPLGAAPTVSA